MTFGLVTKLVTTHGSAWGLIRPQGETRDVFFNDASLLPTGEVADFRLGDDVSFNEERDMVNGSRATHMSKVALSQS